MNWQFWLDPTPKQRKAWAWMCAGFALFFLVFTTLSLFRHQWGIATWQGILFLWNTFFCHINYCIYEEWKKNQKGD